jgi:hypothetical protein
MQVMKWIVNLNMLIISLVHSKGYVQEKRCAFHL